MLHHSTLNPVNKNYLVKTIGFKLQCVILNSTTTTIANLIFLANNTAYAVKITLP